MTSKSRNRTSVATKTKTSEHINTRSTYGLRKSFDWDGLTAVHCNGVRRTSLVDSVLHRFHDKRIHSDAKTTILKIARAYWWPTRDIDVTRHVRSCHICAILNTPNSL